MSEFGVVTAPGTIRLERLLPAPVERVWMYLTDPAKRGTWLAAGPMQLQLGGKIELHFDHTQLSAEATPERFAQTMRGHSWRGRITGCAPPRLLSFTWGEGDADVSEVTFQLTASGAQTHLVLTQRRLAENDMVSVASGWHTHLDILDDQLHGREPRLFWSTHAAYELAYEHIVKNGDTNMATLYHQVWIDAPVSRVYDAVATTAGLGNWWAPHTSTKTDAGLVLAHNPGPEHGDVKMKVLETTADRRVEWEIISTHPTSSPASAWTGTHIVFGLSQRKKPNWMGAGSGLPQMTVLEFRHSGWNQDSEYLGFCNFGWGEALLKLKQWCESR